MHRKPLLVIIEGPTGIGKTDVGIALATWFKTEIISADSRQFYKELSIGTAKPSASQLATVPHHFINTISVFDYYNAYLFDQEVQSFLDSYFKKSNIVFMVGGSGMYIDAVCNGIDLIPDISPEIRDCVTAWYKQDGLLPLQAELMKIDAEYYSKVDKNNPARLIRAIEVFRQTGRPFSEFRLKTSVERDYTILKIALDRNREELYSRINERTIAMIDEGLEQEARQWYPHRNVNALQTVGYNEFFKYFDGDISKAKTIELIQQNTRHYAKKQITWFKKDEDTHWIHASDCDGMIELIQKYR